ncbi:MAG: hypothetical protein ACOCWL_01270, partial [Thermoguttaceae bacterium]
MKRYNSHRFVCFALLGACVAAQPAWASELPRWKLELRPIDQSRVGWAMPDASAAMDIDGDGRVEVLTSMQDADGHPEVLLYRRNDQGGWDRTVVGVVQRHKEEIGWVAVGRPFPGDSRVCVAASVQHKRDGLVVFRLRA